MSASSGVVVAAAKIVAAVATADELLAAPWIQYRAVDLLAAVDVVFAAAVVYIASQGLPESI